MNVPNWLITLTLWVPWGLLIFLGGSAIIVRRAWRRRPLTPDADPDIRAAARRARTAIVVLLATWAILYAIALIAHPIWKHPIDVAGVAVGAVGAYGMDDWGTPWAHCLFFVTPLIAAGGALVAVIVQSRSARLPQSGAPAARRQASLTPRGPLSLSRGPLLALVAVSALALTATMVVFGRIAADDPIGLNRIYGHWAPGSDNGTIALPFPGWYYGIPTLAALVVLLALLAGALWVTARRPAIQSSGLGDADLSWRRDTSTIMMQLTSAVILYVMANALRLGLSCIQYFWNSGENFAPDSYAYRWLFWVTSGVGVAGLVGALVLVGLAARRVSGIVARAQALTPPSPPETIAAPPASGTHVGAQREAQP